MTEQLSDRRRINQLLHSANNCRQMLKAVDRKLAEALQHVYDGDIAQCQTLLEELSEALPQAMAIIEFEEDLQMDETDEQAQEPSRKARG